MFVGAPSLRSKSRFVVDPAYEAETPSIETAIESYVPPFVQETLPAQIHASVTVTIRSLGAGVSTVTEPCTRVGD
jgi:hypothetical protein